MKIKENILLLLINLGYFLYNIDFSLVTDESVYNNITYLDSEAKIKNTEKITPCQENTNNSKLGGNNQKLILFNLGNAMSGPPTNNGSKKLPKPPINAGITIKNIIIIA